MDNELEAGFVWRFIGTREAGGSNLRQFRSQGVWVWVFGLGFRVKGIGLDGDIQRDDRFL